MLGAISGQGVRTEGWMDVSAPLNSGPVQRGVQILVLIYPRPWLLWSASLLLLYPGCLFMRCPFFFPYNAIWSPILIPAIDTHTFIRLYIFFFLPFTSLAALLTWYFPDVLTSFLSFRQKRKRRVVTTKGGILSKSINLGSERVRRKEVCESPSRRACASHFLRDLGLIWGNR